MRHSTVSFTSRQGDANPKSQIPSPKQKANTNAENDKQKTAFFVFCCLLFAVCLEFGAWDLEFAVAYLGFAGPE
jgi:hypothetical protein